MTEDGTGLSYLDFELEIGLGNGQEYPLAVVHSPAGEARTSFKMPFGELELERYLDKLQIALLHSTEKHRQVISSEEQVVQEFGRRLFELLLAGEVRSRYDVSQAQARQQGKGLRLKLRIQPPELAALPWEFLYDPRRDEYVCLSANTPVVRYLELSQSLPPLMIEPPLRILGMVAGPQDVSCPSLDVEIEKRRLERALQPLKQRGLADLAWLDKGDWRTLQRVLRKGPWHIFHFIGHGRYNQVSKQGELAFENEAGGLEPMGAERLATLLADHRPLRLALLNACGSAEGGREDIFSSTAATLVRRGLPAVLAMQYAITDRAAIEIAQAFYEALVDGLPVDAAAAEARKALKLSNEWSLEWGTPVLYTHAPDGALFNLKSVVRRTGPLPKVERTVLPPEQSTTDKRAEKYFQDGLNAFWLKDWAMACQNFRTALETHSNYPEAAAKLAEAEQQARLEKWHAQADAEMKAGNWRAAQDILQKLAAEAPSDSTISALLEKAHRWAQLADLYTQARRFHEGQRWQTVVDIFKQIRALQPSYPDPNRLLESAKHALAQEQEQKKLTDLYTQGVVAFEKGEWRRAEDVLLRLLKAAPNYPGAGWLLERARAEQKQGKKPLSRHKLQNLRWWGIGIAGLAFVGLVLGGLTLWGLLWLAGEAGGSHATATATARQTSLALAVTESPTQRYELTVTQPPPPTNTPPPTETSTETPMLTLTLLPTNITDDKGVTMILVPAGIFTMGGNANVGVLECQKLCRNCSCSRSNYQNEEPAHEVYIDDFYIDRTEVTNAQYAVCVMQGKCTLPESSKSNTRTSYYGNAEYDNYPVIYVDWNQAMAYCEWRETRLPTEAEWEKAARGGLEGKNYPWGDEAPGCAKGAKNGAKFIDCPSMDSVEVSSFAPNGYGLFDMAGNVWEWVQDWYSAIYYSSQASWANPLGPVSGDEHLEPIRKLH